MSPTTNITEADAAAETLNVDQLGDHLIALATRFRDLLKKWRVISTIMVIVYALLAVRGVLTADADRGDTTRTIFYIAVGLPLILNTLAAGAFYYASQLPQILRANIAIITTLIQNNIPDVLTLIQNSKSRGLLHVIKNGATILVTLFKHKDDIQNGTRSITCACLTILPIFWILYGATLVLSSICIIVALVL